MLIVQPEQFFGFCRRLHSASRALAPLVIFGALTASAEAIERVQPRLAAAPSRDAAQEKIDRIAENGAKSPVPPQTTVFTEQEVNQIVRVQMTDLAARGLSDPRVRLLGNNTLAARLIVDLDEYKRRREQRGPLGPLALLSGKVPVSARGVLHSREGRAQLTLEASDINGIPLPPAVVREIIAALSRDNRNPDGYDIEQPFNLPANIRTVAIHPGEAVVRQ
jgi:hypothetical protein